MATFKDMDALLSRFAGNTVPGCGCAIAQKGEILYEGYFGKADLATGRPVAADTLFRLYSMTKVIICTAALIQFERGNFLLTQPYSDFFPEYKETTVAEVTPSGDIVVRPAKSPMLVKHAFNMAVGLPYPDGDSFTAQKMREVREKLAAGGKYTLQDDVRALASVPARYDPGTHWSYGVGHEMVAALIEKTSGMTVGEFLKKEIFEPLGMKDTGYRFFGDAAERLSKIYQPEADGSFTEIVGPGDENLQPDAVYEGGGSGLFSTVRDYLTFTQMLANGGAHEGKQIIGRKTIDLMRRNMLNDDQLWDFRNFVGTYLAGYGYGLGVRTMIDPAGVANPPVGEFGWTGLAGTWTSIDPEDGVSMVYMHQTIPNNEEYHHHRVRAVGYGCIR